MINYTKIHESLDFIIIDVHGLEKKYPLGEDQIEMFVYLAQCLLQHENLRLITMVPTSAGGFAAGGMAPTTKFLCEKMK